MVGSPTEKLRVRPAFGALLGVAAVVAFVLWPSATKNQKSPRVIEIGLELGGTQTLAQHALSDESLAAQLISGKYESISETSAVNSDTKKKIETKAPAVRRPRVLEGMQLTVRDVEVQTHLVYFETQKRQLRASTLASFPVRPVVAERTIAADVEVSEVGESQSAASVDFSSLTPQQRQRLMMSSVEHRPRSYQDSAPAVAGAEEKGSFEERWSQAIAAYPMAQKFAQNSPDNSGPNVNSPGSTNQNPNVWKKSPEPSTTAPAVDNGSSMIVAGYEFSKNAKEVGRSTSSPGAEILRGRVELTMGLAFSGEGQRLRVSQKEMGESISEGTVDLINGTYQIATDVLRKGEIVAELVDQDGHILGIGGLPYERARIEQKIDLKPVPIGIWGQVVSAYGTTGTPWPIAKATLAIDGYTNPTGADAEGRFCFDELDPSSSVILGARSRGHWDTTTMSTVGEANNLTLFPDSMVDALIELSELKPDQRESAKRQGLIWTRILVNDKPIAGAQVWLENQPQAKVVYFNKFQIANTSLASTSENGLVAILNVSPGTHILRARIRASEMPARLVDVRPKSVTTANFEYSRRSVVPVQVYASDNREALPANLSYLGSEKQAFAQTGNIKARVAPGRDPLVIKVEGGGSYLRVLKTVSRESKNIVVTLPQRSEIDTIINSERVSPDPQSGHIVILGAIQGTRVLVDLTHVGDTNLVRGQIRGPRGLIPVVIISNVPVGMRSVQTILPNRQRAAVGTHFVAAGETSLVDLTE